MKLFKGMLSVTVIVIGNGIRGPKVKSWLGNWKGNQGNGILDGELNPGNGIRGPKVKIRLLKGMLSVTVNVTSTQECNSSLTIIGYGIRWLKDRSWMKLLKKFHPGSVLGPPDSMFSITVSVTSTQVSVTIIGYGIRGPKVKPWMRLLKGMLSVTVIVIGNGIRGPRSNPH